MEKIINFPKIQEPFAVIAAASFIFNIIIDQLREMEGAVEMDVEEESTPSSNSFKRVGLKNYIQTNFGDDYVFEIVPKYVLFIFLTTGHFVSLLLICNLR